MTSTCIFADTLVREHPDKCNEYYESVLLNFPVTMIGLRILPRGAPIPGNLDSRSRTEPPNFEFEVFGVDSKAQEPVKLLYIGGGKYAIEKSVNDIQLKPILTDQILIRGAYRYLTIAIFADSPKFHRPIVSSRDSKSDLKKEEETNSDDDDFYDEWAYVKNIRDIHGDKIYPITYDSDLPKSDSDEEQEPRMALPLAPPTLPDNIKVLATDKQEKLKIEIDDETRRYLEKAPQVNQRPGPLDLPSFAPEKLLPVHLIKIKAGDAYTDEKTEKPRDKSSARLKTVINDLGSTTEGIRKVNLLEEAADCVIPWLEQLDVYLIEKLIKEVVKSIKKSYDIAELPPTATVRLLKAGLRLTQLISVISEEMTNMLLAEGAMKRLIYLLAVAPKNLASSLRIQVIQAIDQIISWPKGLKSFLRFNKTNDGVTGSGYETLVGLILQKSTVRVVYAAGQILSKINFALTAQQLRGMVFHLLEKSPFYDNKIDENISSPNYVSENGARDTDTEDIDENEYAAEKNFDFKCPLNEVVDENSVIFNNETILKIVQYLKTLKHVVLNPNSISEITAKELPNRARSQVRSAKQGLSYISQQLASVEIVKVCLGILHIPFLSANWPVYAALSDFLLTLTSTKEGLLLFAADHISSNYIIETLLSSFEAPLKTSQKDELDYAVRTDVDTPSNLAATLAIRLQAIGLLDEVLAGSKKEKWSLTHWSPLQSLCSLFSHSDELSRIVADACSFHASLIINVMKDNGPSSSQAAELLHTIIENSTCVGWVEEIESLVVSMMESDIPREIFSKLFAGSVQFNLNNSITAMKRLNEGLEYGASLELINGPGLSFHSRIVKLLLTKSQQNIIYSLSLNIMQVLMSNLDAVNKSITFNSIVGQPLSQRAHIQVKQIVISTLASIDIIIEAINSVGSSYPDSNLANTIMVSFAMLFSIPDFGDDLFEKVTRLVVDVFHKYLRNPRKQNDLNLSSWYIVLRHMVNLFESKPLYALPLMILLNRILPCRSTDEYMGYWRLILSHEEIGNEIVEILIVFTHSAHPEISKLAINIIKQLSLIRQGENKLLAQRIHTHFVPKPDKDEHCVMKTTDGQPKHTEVFKWNRGTQLLTEILEPGMFTDEQIKGLIEILMAKLTAISKDALVEAHIVPTKSLSNLISKILELKLASLNDIMLIISSATEIISNQGTMHFLLNSIVLNTLTASCKAISRDEIKVVREKLIRLDIKKYLTSLISKIEQERKKKTMSAIYVDIYHFIRMLEDVLDKSHLVEIFHNGETKPTIIDLLRNGIEANLENDGDNEEIREISRYFFTFDNPARYSSTAPIINSDDLNDNHVPTVGNMETGKLYNTEILYPTFFRHSDKADKYLVSHCEFIDFSREMGNLKIDEDLQKVMVEPEMTCLNEEDAKHDAFSTRIGRSFNFQKRSDHDVERRRGGLLARSGPPFGGSSRGRTVYRKSGQTRPAAMHVDDYQAVEDDGHHDHKRTYSPDQYDSSNHSPRYRSPNYSSLKRDRGSPGSYDKERRDRSQSPFNDRPRPYRSRGVSVSYRGSNPIRGYRGSPRGRGTPPFRGSRGAPQSRQARY